MTFGAINELSTAQGYRRLMELANHPVLTHILRGDYARRIGAHAILLERCQTRIEKIAFSRKVGAVCDQ